jgi:tetratricopeptide (TPR) repeat protein
MTLDPSFALARMRLGMSLYMLGRKEEGRESISLAAEHAERMPERERDLAGILDACFDAEDPALARERLRAFHLEHPEDAEAAFWEAQAEADVLGDPIGSIKILRKVVALDPDNLPAVATLSRRMIELGQPEAARGIVLDYSRRYPQAAPHLTRILELAGAGD